VGLIDAAACRPLPPKGEVGDWARRDLEAVALLVLVRATQVESVCGGFSISITAPVVGSIFLTGEAALDEPSNSLPSACL
jgi:hypothetical protein